MYLPSILRALPMLRPCDTPAALGLLLSDSKLLVAKLVPNTPTLAALLLPIRFCH
jgi:hypothetical protein